MPADYSVVPILPLPHHSRVFLQRLDSSIHLQYSLLSIPDPVQTAAGIKICIFYLPRITLLTFWNTSSWLNLSSEISAILSASSSFISTLSTRLAYFSSLKTTIVPYPFLVRYTGCSALTNISISGNLFLRSDTGLICIIIISFIFYTLPEFRTLLFSFHPSWLSFGNTPSASSWQSPPPFLCPPDTSKFS